MIDLKDFIKEHIASFLNTRNDILINSFFKKSLLLQYLNLKMNYIDNKKARRSLGIIYSLYALLVFYNEDFYNRPTTYKSFNGYRFTKIANFYKLLYGGKKLQNHSLNYRINFEFRNKVAPFNNNLIISNDGKYLIHIDYLYVNNLDIARLSISIIEEYITLLKYNDIKLFEEINDLILLKSSTDKKIKLKQLINENSDARFFEIISYSILKNYYRTKQLYFGFSLNNLKKESLKLYKIGTVHQNDRGIDFIMKPLGKIFQVTTDYNFDKYILDLDKLNYYPTTFVIRTNETSEKLKQVFNAYINKKASGMEVLIKKYSNAIEDIITTNELKDYLDILNITSINNILADIKCFYTKEFNIS